MKNIVTQQIYINRASTTSWIYENADIGKIIYRKKIDTLIGTPHPGIVLGEDIWGTVWIIHNHYKNGKVEATWEAVWVRIVEKMRYTEMNTKEGTDQGGLTHII